MNVKFNVTRFNNEDVIATSFIPPVLCDHIGAHFQTNGEVSYGTNANGEQKMYFAGTQYIWDGKKMTLYPGGDVSIEMPIDSDLPSVGQYYYYDDAWFACTNDH